MSDYLFIQSQDPLTEVRSHHQFSLASQLVEAGNNVRVLLVQNAVIPARHTVNNTSLEALIDSGVAVMADDFSLQQRQIANTEVNTKITVQSIDIVIDALLDGHKVIWN